MSAMDGIHTWDWIGIPKEEYNEKAKKIQDTAKENKEYGSCLKCGRELKWSRFGYSLCRWCSGKYRKWILAKLKERKQSLIPSNTDKEVA